VLSDVFGNKANVVDDSFDIALEVALSKNRVLCGDTGSTVIQMANAQELAAHRNHRPGAEAETLGAEHGSFDYIETGF